AAKTLTAQGYKERHRWGLRQKHGIAHRLTRPSCVISKGLLRIGGTSAANFVVSMHLILRGSPSLSPRSRVGVISKTNPFAPWMASLFSTPAAEAASCRNRWRGSAGG